MRVDLLHNLFLDNETHRGPLVHVTSVHQRLDGDVRSVLFIPRTPLIPASDRCVHSWRPGRGDGALANLLMNVGLLVTYLRYVRRNGKPRAIYSRGLFPMPALLSKLLRVPFVFELNGVRHEELRAQGQSRFMVRLARRMILSSASRARRVVAVTPAVRDYLVSEGISAEKIEVIENGADVDRFAPRDERKAQETLGLPSATYVCFVGALFPWQGTETLVEAAPLVLKDAPGTRFLIVGNGPERGPLEARARGLGVESAFLFTGVVPHARVPDLVGASRVCVAPMRAMKVGHSPLKIFEYMAAARPVVASRVEGLEFLEQSGGGLLSSPGDAPELATNLLHLLADAPRSARMGAQGRAYILTHHTWDSVAKRTEAILVEVSARE